MLCVTSLARFILTYKIPYEVDMKSIPWLRKFKSGKVMFPRLHRPEWKRSGPCPTLNPQPSISQDVTLGSSHEKPVKMHIPKCWPRDSESQHLDIVHLNIWCWNLGICISVVPLGTGQLLFMNKLNFAISLGCLLSN